MKAIHEHLPASPKGLSSKSEESSVKINKSPRVDEPETRAI